MSHFKLSWQIIPLQLKELFTISRGSKSEVGNVFISLSKNGYTGYGEAAPNIRYQETSDKVVEYIEAIPAGFFEDVHTPDELFEKFDDIEHEPVQSARVALEMAWLDWWGKSQEQPLWKLWDYGSAEGPVTSFTIGIDTPEKMQQKILDAPEYSLYKIKLGSGDDREIITAIREVTSKPLRVDANEGWVTLGQAKREIAFLASQNVELIEQPMPAADLEKMKELSKWSPLPLVADESFTGDENLEEIAEAFHVINIKLMKIGSLVRARKVLEQARELGLKVMIGCMIESSLANAAGSLLALKANYADQDGHLLINNDPFSGLRINEKGAVLLSDNPGLGVQKLA
ncbi:dipeptide epimerase [Gracilimonas mengyeensis]|uniref:Dipeptide epimerase n=1 Tax=Gracilimonas mengyeensis TaxID=1302730 RepID=A0A521CB53_9BACT|nr:dipeptide epimerase [Gracilimonas mengyeensis]SMO56646.1 L-alanine-DL-glutamate epimerase [Gracilimonas mengyeensis]